MNSVYLIGFMGTGKSTVGHLLAKELNRTFIDTDELIVEKAGMEITEIFKKQGEDYFRALEEVILKQIISRDDLVVSTGGGFIVNSGNIEIMHNSGILITLIAAPEIIYERVKDYNDRPLLDVDNPIEEIKTLLFSRASYYIKSDYIVDTSSITPKETVQEIIGYISD